MDTEQPEQKSQVDGAVLAWAFRKFVAAFPGSFPDEAAVTDKVELWRELLEQHPTVTKGAFVAAVYEIAWKHKDDFLPGPAVALDFFRAAQLKIDRETQKALPPPAPVTDTAWARMSGPERVAFFERHVAIGKLRAERGVSLVGFDGELVPFAPTEVEIAGVIGQMRARRFLHATLERIAERDAPPAEVIAGAMTGRWPGADK